MEQQLNIMKEIVKKVHKVSNRDFSTLKIFLAPEFYFCGMNGAFQYLTEEEENKERSHICRILRGLKDIVVDKPFGDWLFLFGTVIASKALPKEDQFDYQLR